MGSIIIAKEIKWYGHHMTFILVAPVFEIMIPIFFIQITLIWVSPKPFWENGKKGKIAK